MPKNPKWTRDELILALDLYFRVNPLHSSETHPEIVALSALLNRLPIHAQETTGENFRNPNGVYMKLCNFLRFDPDYQGVGLSAGAKLDGVIWQAFSGDKKALAEVAKSIRTNFEFIAPPKTAEEEAAQEEDEFAEGRILARMHQVRERNGTLPKKKKAQVLAATGKLECEVCGFDFAVKYGEAGKGFAECHHNKPVSSLAPGQSTKLTELSIVCANCHRMIHLVRPWKTVAQLKDFVL